MWHPSHKLIEDAIASSEILFMLGVGAEAVDSHGNENVQTTKVVIKFTVVPKVGKRGICIFQSALGIMSSRLIPY
jgi:hypothetical protein